MKILNNNASNVIKNNIARFGRDIAFKRANLNKYKEVESYQETEKQRCIYHTASDLANGLQSDAGKTHSHKKEMLLTVYNENIMPEDYCNIGDRLYRITSIENYQNDSEFIDIVLTEVRNESN